MQSQWQIRSACVECELGRHWHFGKGISGILWTGSAQVQQLHGNGLNFAVGPAECMPWWRKLCQTLWPEAFVSRRKQCCDSTFLCLQAKTACPCNWCSHGVIVEGRQPRERFSIRGRQGCADAVGGTWLALIHPNCVTGEGVTNVGSEACASKLVSHFEIKHFRNSQVHSPVACHRSTFIAGISLGIFLNISAGRRHFSRVSADSHLLKARCPGKSSLTLYCLPVRSPCRPLMLALPVSLPVPLTQE